MTAKDLSEKKPFGLAISQRDLLVMKIIAPIIWVMFAWATYLAFASGRIGEGIGHCGFLLVIFSGLVHLLGLIDPDRDVALSKLLTIATLFGILVCATGWMIRLTT